MRRIARFLDIEVPEAKWPILSDAATFASMKRDAALLGPEMDMIFGGPRRVSVIALCQGVDLERLDVYVSFSAPSLAGPRVWSGFCAHHWICAVRVTSEIGAELPLRAPRARSREAGR